MISVKDFSIVVAMTKKGVIGEDGWLPWDIPEEMSLFREITKNGVVIMGRKTFEAIGKPMKGRVNIVVSRREHIPSPAEPPLSEKGEYLEFVNSFEEAVDLAKSYGNRGVFVIGGRQIYEEAEKVVGRMQVSWVKKDYDGDTYFPKIEWNNWREVSKKDFEEFEFVEYERAGFEKFSSCGGVPAQAGEVVSH